MPARKHAHDDVDIRAEFSRQQNAHDASLRKQGFDPNYIGCTEIEPVRCTCGKPIPLRVLSGYARR